MTPDTSKQNVPNWVKEGGLFAAKLSVFTLSLYGFFSLVENALQVLETRHVRSILHALGERTQDALIEYQFYTNGKLIEISSLCAGLLEFCFLAGVILATKTRSWKSRLKGVLVGVILLYVFNLFRMVITIMQLNHTTISFAEFTHDVLFRFVLLLGFSLVYGVWLNWESVEKYLKRQGVIS